MTKKRDYATEILEALAGKPANGLSLQQTLHINPSVMYGVLESLEGAGKIEWHQISKIDGVWKVSKN